MAIPLELLDIICILIVFAHKRLTPISANQASVISDHHISFKIPIMGLMITKNQKILITLYSEVQEDVFGRHTALTLAVVKINKHKMNITKIRLYNFAGPP